MKKPKGYQRGGKTGGMMRKVPKGMANGGKLKMVTNDKGQEVPFFAADGKGKMAGGGKTKVANKMMPKGYFKGGKALSKGGTAGGKKKADEKKKPRGKTLLEQKMDAMPSDKARFRGKKPPEA